MADCTKCANRNNDYCIFACENGESFKPITNADRVRAMADEELAELIGDNIDCSICKKEVFKTTTCPGSLTADGKDCYAHWLDWLRQEVTDGEQS